MGQAVVRQLAKSGFAPRAISRTPGIFEQDQFFGTTVVEGDFGDVDGLAGAFAGVDAICSAIPSLALGSDEYLQYAQNLVDAAKQAGVRRVVHNSMQWAPEAPCGAPFYDAALEAENVIAGSSLDVTIFRLVLFMDNLITGFAKPNLVNHGVYRYCQKPGLPLNWIAMDDVARFVVAALTRDDLIGRRIAIGGEQALTAEDVAEILSEVLNRPIVYEYEDPYEFGARVHDEMGLEAVMPRDVYSDAMGRFYTFNNESPHRPFQVNMEKVLKEIPITMTGLREWALRQDWTPEGHDGAKVGSMTS